MKTAGPWSAWLARLDIPLFKLGSSELTLGSLVGALLALLALLIFSRWLRNWLVHRVLARGRIDLSTRETIASLVRYVVLFVGIITIVQGMGINLASFTVLAGALGVGVGFGLQNIFSNFISGLIVMLERPVKIGDHIIVAGVEGDVLEIGARATTLLTAQGNKAIIPNQMFITGNVVNWDVRGSTSAMVLSLRMKGEAAQNETLLLKALASRPEVLKQPSPSVYVTGIDYQGHVLEVHYSLAGNATERLRVASAVNKAILKAVAESGAALAPNP